MVFNDREVTAMLQELTEEFSRFDKALGVWFSRNASGPVCFNVVNAQIRPQVRVRTLERVKRIWNEVWNVWALDDDLLVDAWLASGDKFHNDQRVVLRKEMMEKARERLAEFKKRLAATSPDDIVSILEGPRSKWADPHSKWMDTAGFNVSQSEQRRRKEMVRGLLDAREEADAGRRPAKQAGVLKPTKDSSKSRQLSMLERIRAKEAEKKAQASELAEAKRQKAKQATTDQFTRIYSVIYEQAPKFGPASTGMSVARLQKLVQDSAGQETDASKFEETVKHLVSRVAGLSLVTVGGLAVVKIGALNRRADLEALSGKF